MADGIRPAVALLMGGALSVNLAAQTLSTNSGVADVQLSSAYEYQPVIVSPSVSGPALPLDITVVSNAQAVRQELALTQSAADALVTNGFVVVPFGTAANMTVVYSNLSWQSVPVFVTSDSMLHLYHLQLMGYCGRWRRIKFLPQLSSCRRRCWPPPKLITRR